MSNIDDVLAARDKDFAAFGTFAERANVIQGIKQVMKSGGRWDAMADDQKEALEMVAHKIARIVHGDPGLHDSWLDIAGYAKLVADRLEQEGKAVDLKAALELATAQMKAQNAITQAAMDLQADYGKVPPAFASAPVPAPAPSVSDIAAQYFTQEAAHVDVNPQGVATLGPIQGTQGFITASHLTNGAA